MIWVKGFGGDWHFYFGRRPIFEVYRCTGWFVIKLFDKVLFSKWIGV